jgi:N-acyl-D-aspartate/D-glutamate deacylase
MDFTLKSPYVFEGLQSWQPALPLRGGSFIEKLKSKTFREGIRAELSAPAHFRLFNGEWDKVEVVESKTPAFEGSSIAALARQAGKHPLDFLLDLAVEENLETVFNALLLNSDEEAVGRMLRDPGSLVSLSDAGAHLTFFNDAGYGLHLLGHWVRELGALTLEQAAHQLTGRPASVFGIKERGTLRVGHYADLLLFDPAKVGRGPRTRVFDLPGGHPRLTTEPRGVHGVWVNGRPPAELPGKLLRDFAA